MKIISTDTPKGLWIFFTERGLYMKVFKTKDLMEIFGFGKTKMYQVLQKGILPATKIGNEYLISEDALNEWFKRNQGKEIKL